MINTHRPSAYSMFLYPCLLRSPVCCLYCYSQNELINDNNQIESLAYINDAISKFVFVAAFQQRQKYLPAHYVIASARVFSSSFYMCIWINEYK